MPEFLRHQNSHRDTDFSHVVGREAIDGDGCGWEVTGLGVWRHLVEDHLVDDDDGHR